MIALPNNTEQVSTKAGEQHHYPTIAIKDYEAFLKFKETDKSGVNCVSQSVIDSFYKHYGMTEEETIEIFDSYSLDTHDCFDSFYIKNSSWCVDVYWGEYKNKSGKWITVWSENCHNCAYLEGSKNCTNCKNEDPKEFLDDCIDCNECEYCKNCNNCYKLVGTDYSTRCENNNDCRESNSLNGCKNCYMCNNLENCNDCGKCNGCSKCNSCSKCSNSTSLEDCNNCNECENCNKCESCNLISDKVMSYKGWDKKPLPLWQKRKNRKNQVQEQNKDNTQIIDIDKNKDKQNTRNR